MSSARTPHLKLGWFRIVSISQPVFFRWALTARMFTSIVSATLSAFAAGTTSRMLMPFICTGSFAYAAEISSPGIIRNLPGSMQKKKTMFSAVRWVGSSVPAMNAQVMMSLSPLTG